MSGDKREVLYQHGCDTCKTVAEDLLEHGKSGGFCHRHEQPRLLTIPAQPTQGVKHDSGKPPMSLLSGAALTEVAKVLEFGAKKYAAHNWKGGFAWSRLASAALRHLFAWIGGEDKDPETGLSHLAHCSCCLMFLLDFEVNGLGTDDRYKKS